jgi:cell wall-associated NlpC family hydrolase
LANLIAQLAALKNTTAETEAAYLQGQTQAREEQRAREDQASAPGKGGGQQSPPAAAIVAAVIGYARAQIRKPYKFGEAGPREFDCSGLTVQAYAHAGISVGSHSVNSQWPSAAQRGPARTNAAIQRPSTR